MRMDIPSYDRSVPSYDGIWQLYTSYDGIWQYIHNQRHLDFSYFSVSFWCLSMHAFTSHALYIVSCSQKWKNQCADHAWGILVYPAIYWDILVYTVTCPHTPPCTLTPKFRTSAYVSDVWTCIHLPPRHIASYPAVKVEKNHCADHASDILVYTSISKYILVYTVSYYILVYTVVYTSIYFYILVYTSIY